MLDYPVYLREGEELLDQQRRQPQMVEVGYFHITGDDDPMLVTSYGAEEAEIDSKVVPHFKRYKEVCAGFGLALKIAITPLFQCVLLQRIHARV